MSSTSDETDSRLAGSEDLVSPWLGCLDIVRHDRIEGWAQDSSSNEPVLLRILDNGIPIGEIRADGFREDLQIAGIGDGRHAFSYEFPLPLDAGRRHVIEIRRADDGRLLKGSPALLEADSRRLPFETAGPAPWRGSLDAASREQIDGWAWDPRTPDVPLRLLVVANGEIIGRLLANRFRDDLAAAGIGDGRHAFTFSIPGGLSALARQVIQVVGESDSCEITGSPVVLSPGTGFDEPLKNAIAAAVDGLVTEQQREEALKFLSIQSEQLIQRSADDSSMTHVRLARQQLERRWGKTFVGEQGEKARRALVVDDYVPDVSRDAASVALLSHMQALQKLGYEVSFVASRTLTISAEARADMEALGIECCCLPYYASVEEVFRRQSDAFEVIYLHRVTNAEPYLALARRFGGQARIVFSVADLHFLRLARQAKVQETPEVMTLSAKVRRAEMLAASSANAVITHSSIEADLLRQAVKDCNVHVVPWAVPINSSGIPWSRRHDIAYIGNYAHASNTDAVTFLVRHIMPRVWLRNSLIRCRIVGSNLPENVKQLAGRDVEIVGHVPHLSAVLDGIRLTVAPSRFGSGIKAKVLESLAAGVPCIMSPIAAEGLALPAALADLVAKDQTQMVDLIVGLTSDEKAWNALALAALDFMTTNYSEDATIAALKPVLLGSRLMIEGGNAPASNSSAAEVI
jgi:glycosyltransferase involved in cell wall biosynthesis